MAARRKGANPRIERKLTRVSGVREVKQTFLIVCEGVNTEPDYFNTFRLTSAHVKAVGHGMNTLTLVQKAIHIREEERRKGRSYNQNWIVFDKDDFPEKDFNTAIFIARQNGFEVAYSNPKQQKAIQHAKIVMKQFNGNNPAQDESSTTVYQLIEELIRFL